VSADAAHMAWVKHFDNEHVLTSAVKQFAADIEMLLELYYFV